MSKYNHRFAPANGNLEALEPRRGALLIDGPQPIPTNIEMVASSFETLKPILLNAISEFSFYHL